MVSINVGDSRVEVAAADEGRFAGEIGVSEGIHDGAGIVGVARDVVSFVDFDGYEVSLFVLSFQLCGGKG